MLHQDGRRILREMGRKIKYRAIDRATNQWVYGYPYKSELGNWFILTETSKYHIKEETLGKFVTTLNDKEVYEGDLIYVAIPASDVADVPRGSGLYHHDFYKVCYNDSCASYFPFDEFVGYCEEVVGNVHDCLIEWEGKRYKALCDDNDDPVRDCSKCAFHSAGVCLGDTEFCNVYQADNHIYWHFESE